MISRGKSESLQGIKLSGGACVICGWSKTDYKGRSLVIGAHVRGFRNTPDYDNHNNIIGLCPNHHSEFDAGNITITSMNKVIHINNSDEYHNKRIIGQVNHILPGHLDFHNKNIYKASLKAT